MNFTIFSSECWMMLEQHACWPRSNRPLQYLKNIEKIVERFMAFRLVVAFQLTFERKTFLEKCFHSIDYLCFSGTLDLLCDYALHLSDNCQFKW